MELAFILLRPRVAENIGAAARAIHTMGFGDLRLIQPRNHQRDRCKWVACKGRGVLENATLYDSLVEATADLDFVIGTTAKERKAYYDYYEPRQLQEFLATKAGHYQRIGVVFGPEDSGLSNDDLKRCDLLTSIPANEEYGVLNLAQSIMIYAYELRSLSQASSHPGQRATSQQLSHRVFKDKMAELFQLIDVDPEDVKIKRVFEKASFLCDEDLRLIHYLRKKVLFKIDRHNWRRGR